MATSPRCISGTSITGDWLWFVARFTKQTLSAGSRGTSMAKPTSATLRSARALAEEAFAQPTVSSLSLDVVKADPEVEALIRHANLNLGVLGFTEHGFRHVNLVSSIARNVLRLLGYDERHQELAAIAGYLHDVGNVVNRHGHALTGAMLAHGILLRLGMSFDDIAVVMGAIGSHDGDNNRLGEAVHSVSAALTLADKSDVHRSRVRNPEPSTFDQHDQVNYAATGSFLRVDGEAKTITLELTIDTDMASVMQYFEIFLPRMQMCRNAAEMLGCEFHIVMNNELTLL